MAEWTSDAKEYLEGYLRQVAALARSQGDDGDDIAAGLREHITNEVEADATNLVTVEHIRKLIASLGTPEQVVSPDFTLAARERKESGERQAPPPPRREPPIVVNVPREKARSGCSTAALTILLLAIALPILIAILGTLTAILLPAVSRAREAARRASCQGNLKQVAMVCGLFARDHDGMYPDLSATPGEFCMEPTEIYPKYLKEPLVLTCPSDATPPDSSGTIDERLDDASYFYLGYVVTNDVEAHAFIDAYQKAVAEDARFSGDLPVSPGFGSDGSNKLLHLRDFTSADESLPKPLPSPAEIPVMIDREDNHIPGGINVLYLDGHVEFVKMGTKFPAERWFLDELAQISGDG